MTGHHGKIGKGRESGGRWLGIWVADCECGWHTQYWAWGAVLGSLFQHLWKEAHA
jgi:hypothetical protein